MVFMSPLEAASRLVSSKMLDSKPEEVVKPAEDVQRNRVIVAELRFQDMQGLHEVVSSIDFVALAFLQLSEVSQGVSEHLVLGAELLASHRHRVSVETLRLVEFLPALVLASLLEKFGDFAQGRAALVIRLTCFGEFILRKNQSRLRFCHVGPFEGFSFNLTEGWLYLLYFSLLRLRGQTKALACR